MYFCLQSYRLIDVKTLKGNSLGPWERWLLNTAIKEKDFQDLRKLPLPWQEGWPLNADPCNTGLTLCGSWQISSKSSFCCSSSNINIPVLEAVIYFGYFILHTNLWNLPWFPHQNNWSTHAAVLALGDTDGSIVMFIANQYCEVISQTSSKFGQC